MRKSSRIFDRHWADEGRTQAEVKSKLSAAAAESPQLDVSRSGEYMVAEWLRFKLSAKPNIRPSASTPTPQGRRDRGRPHGAGKKTASKKNKQRTGREAELPAGALHFSFI